MNDSIELKGPVTLTLQPQSLVTIVQALNEAPYKIAKPIIDEILAQIQKAQP